MNILIITTNGITREFESWPERLQGRALSAAGHRVRAYTYIGDKSWNRESREKIDGVEVSRLPRKWFSLKLVSKLWREPRPDVVHLHHLSNQFTFVAALVCKIRRIPAVFTPHGLYHDPYLVNDRDRPFESPPRYQEVIITIPQLLKYLFHRFKPKRGLKNYLTHAPLRMADRLVALSSHDREVLIKLGVKPEKIAIIPNAIDPDWHTGVEPAHKSHDEMRVLFLGQFKYRKGFDLLVKAMPAVIKRFPEARFIFPGHSPVHKDDLLQLLDEGGVRGYAQLPGFVSEREKAALFLSSEVYVLPTRYEGFGIPLIEAMSAGCPVVSSDIPVINEIIKDGQTGLLFEYNNHEKLAEVLVHILENPLLRHKLAENGRREAEKYYTPRVIKQLEALYREACGLPALPNSAGIKSL